MNPEKPISANAVATLFDGSRTEFFVVGSVEPNRLLVTTQFYEQRPDLGEIEELKSVNWETALPDDAEPFLPTAGLRRNTLNAFWIGWVDDSTVAALSVYQEEAITWTPRPEDALIRPAVISPDKGLHQYFWRASDGNWALYRLEFSGELGKPGSVESRRLLQTTAKPSLSTVRPVPGSESDRVVVSWISETDGELYTHAVQLLDGARSAQIVPHRIAAGQLLPQRLALHVSGMGAAQASFFMRTPLDSLVIVAAEFDFEEEEASFNYDSVPYTGESPISSIQAFYFNDAVDADRFFVLLDEAGTLLRSKPGSSLFQTVRDDVDMEVEYDFPIFVSSGMGFEVVVGESGSVRLIPV